MARPEEVRAALRHIDRLAEEVRQPFGRAMRLLQDGALTGPAAVALAQGMAQRHLAVQRTFSAAFERVLRLAPVPGVTPPHLGRPPTATPPGVAAASGARGGDPDRMEQLAGELRRTGKALESAARTLGAITGRLGLEAAMSRSVEEAGAWSSTRATDVRRRRERLVHADDGVGTALASAMSVVTQALTGGSPSTVALLQKVRTGDRAALAQLLAIQRSSADPGLPSQVAVWWPALTEADRQRLLRMAPGQLGALDGLPADVRDAANRSHLGSEKQRLLRRIADLQNSGRTPSPQPLPLPTADLFDPEPELGDDLGDLKGKLRGIETLERQLAVPPPDGGPRRYLLGFDLRGNGHTILSVGNPDDADNVVTYVPGLGTTLAKAEGDVTRAVRMYGQATAYAPGKKTASIYWLGYDAPNLAEVATTTNAEAAAPLLHSFEAGLHAAHHGTSAHWTMLGHSYGTLVVGTTAKRTGAGFTDDIIFVGSPGVGVAHAQDLGMSGGHVWSGRSKFDPVPDLPPFNPGRWFDTHTSHFGNDPTSPEFGGRRFEVQAGDPSAELHDHSIYWDENTISLSNMARVVDGQYGKVSWREPPPAPAPEPSPTAPDPGR